ncbi:MAG TPA: SGNH/GDSL hydrolase family protein [Azospirillum sp.]|nr:SGNH/GDSL hydrolase family protein [Azospirillum sp.]
MMHVVLLGDSIFDNAAYVAGSPDVVEQLRACLPAGAKATLKAVDGAVTDGVARQLQGLPPDATHLVVSVGGNDALGHSGILDEAARSVAEVVGRLADVRESFAQDYRAMLDAVTACGLPTAVCTIYDARYPDPLRQRLVVTGLSIFNDVIMREAFARGLPLIDLRLICGEDADYANPVEPSAQGGAKIAAAIAAMVAEHDFGRRRSSVFAR